ncbi:MAG: adenylate/guanylate cyclase domain-containing protein [Rhodospirillaceae bacterium]|nr:adenylate/guanylate cyclase domain-containing protein [Rhodospirillaceae bacterium]
MRRRRTSPRGIFMLRRLRLLTGAVLFTFIATHFANHALGLVSLEAMEEGRLWFLMIWRGPIGRPLLYIALLVHWLLALWAIYQRRRWRMPLPEALQLLLGLAIIPMLWTHVIGTRGATSMFGHEDSYAYVLLIIWHQQPADGARQALALLVAWTHGCTGLYFWLRLRPWFAKAVPWLYGGALIVPILGLLGFVSGGRAVAELAADPAFVRQIMAGRTAGQYLVLREIIDGVTIAFVSSLVLVLAARVVRGLVERRRGLIRISYPGGRQISTMPGMSVLEASQRFGIPHASVCGGRGRCSTCRVRIGQGLEALPPPSPIEKRVLDRVGAAPNVRLACQIRPLRDLEITPLLPATATAAAGFRQSQSHQGREQEIAILFADIRRFTTLAESKLPYDVVFILNRYFAAMGQAVEKAGGQVDKFIGDGVMALFGVDTDAARGCRQALAAAKDMAARIDDLNNSLHGDLIEPLRIGIGIHNGPVIVGEMGYARAVSLTAVGDAVNTASRLETLTKEFGVQLVVSEGVADRAGIDLAKFPRHEVEVRGRTGTLPIRAIADARELP